MWSYMGDYILTWIIFLCCIRVSCSVEDDDQNIPRKTHKKVPPDIPVRIVATSDILKGEYQIKWTNSAWTPLCWTDHNVKNDLDKRAKESYANATADGYDVAGFVKLECANSDSCDYINTTYCDNKTSTTCENDGGPEHVPPPLSICSYPGETKYNCSTNQLWMTYENIFFKGRKELPNRFMAWTSSYIALHSGSSCKKNDTCLSTTLPYNSSLHSDLDCLTSCFTYDNNTLPIAAVAIQTKKNDCSCYTRRTANCQDLIPCDARLYEVKPFTKESSRDTQQYCITYGTENTQNKTFTVKNCSAYLPLVCGKNSCKSMTPCQNGGTCELMYNYDYRCNCMKGFQGMNCSEQSSTFGSAATSTSTSPTIKAESDGTQIVTIIVSLVVGLLVMASLFIVGVVCIYKYRTQRHVEEVQRPHSAFNKTYGNVMSQSEYNRVDDDALSIYDLLDEERMMSTKNTNDKDILLLEEYSQPSDVGKMRQKSTEYMAEYTTTYDDPIRKDTDDEIEDIKETSKLTKNQCDLRSDSSRSENETKGLKRGSNTEESENDVTENDSKVNQFKGCFCSMNISADSDIESPNNVPTDQTHTKNTYKDKIVSYYKLNPLKLPDLKQVASDPEAPVDQSKSKTNACLEDYETAFIEPGKIMCENKCKCKKTQEDIKQEQDEDSDYEDTTMPVGNQRENKRRSRSLHNTKDVCLHSTAEELLSAMGIKLVLDCPYETYAALPRSRADMLNPYYSSGQRPPLAPPTQSKGDNLSKKLNNDRTIKTKCAKEEKSMVDKNDTTYDKIKTAKKCEETSESNKTNIYDHIPGFLTNQFSRKRLNTF